MSSTALFPGVEDRDHVGVIDRRSDLRLAPEALAEAIVLQSARGGSPSRATGRWSRAPPPGRPPHVANPMTSSTRQPAIDGAERKRVGGGGPEPVVPGPDLAPAPQGWAEAEARVSQAAAEPGSQVRAGGSRRRGRGRTGHRRGGRRRRRCCRANARSQGRTADAHRVAHLERLGLADAHAIHERAVRGSQILDAPATLAVPDHARDGARARIEPPLPAFCTPDHELVI